MNSATQTASNQVPDLTDYNVFDTDVVLRDFLEREGARAHGPALSRYGADVGRQAMFALARRVNRHGPVLEQFDRHGQRVDRVVFDPGWHVFLGMQVALGMHGLAWLNGRPGAHVARAAAYLLHGQVEAGSLCPITMTAAAIPILRREAWFDDIGGRLAGLKYDERDLPVAEKTSMLVGMGMTEKQGGSDLRTVRTYAKPLGGEGRGKVYSLVGHKWFFSSPMSDAHLVLADSTHGFSCFFVPRWRDDGTRNAVVIQRLKDKLGNLSNASAEVEFEGAHGRLVGEPGKGIAVLAGMAAHTRMDCVLGSAALLRQSVVQAIHYARHRVVFSSSLVDQPLMQSVLADLALESEAASVLALSLAAAFDRPEESPLVSAWRRIMTPASKFWVCKRAVQAVAECMEVMGGNGYIETFDMARAYREAPVNAIWEGSGNIMCLDVLRAMGREPDQARALLDDLKDGCHDEPAMMRRLSRLQSLAGAGQEAGARSARFMVQELVLLAQAVLLRRTAPSHVARAFIDTRLGGDAGQLQGAFSLDLPGAFLIDRAWAG